MRTRGIPSFLSLTAILITLSPAAAEPMKIVVKRLPDAVSAATKFLNPEYVVASPAAGEVNDKTPLLIFLHGSGERGSDLTNLKAAAPVKYFNQ